MTIAKVASTAAQTTNQSNVTTTGIDTTGAALLVAAVMEEVGTTSSVSDSKGNTWVPLTAAVEAVTGLRVRLWYSIPTSVGSGHTFTVSTSVHFPGVWFAGFSATNPVPLDVESAGATQTSGTTIQPGSASPRASTELFITAFTRSGANGESGTIDSSFTVDANLGQTNNADGVHVAFKIQTTKAAENPIWTTSSGIARAAVMAVFSAAVPWPKQLILRQSVNRPVSW